MRERSVCLENRRSLLTVIGLQVFVGLIAGHVFGYPYPSVSKTYGSPGQEFFYCVQPAPGGGFVAAGKMETVTPTGVDAWVVRLDGAGNPQWQRRYDAGFDSTDFACWIEPTPIDGGYIVAGQTYTPTASWDLWLLKLDAGGAVVWQKTYGGTGEDVAKCVQPTADGGYILGASTLSFGSGSWDVWLLKLDASGTIEWEKTFGDSGSDVLESVRQTADSGFVVAGYTDSFGSTDAWAFQVDSTGETLLWSRTYGGGLPDAAHWIEERPGGGFVIVGETESFGAGGADAWLAKLGAGGNVLWAKTYGGSGNDIGRAVHPTSDGGYIIAAETDSFGAGGTDAWFIKTQPDGTPQWQATYGGLLADSAPAIVEDPDGNMFLAAGYAASFGAGVNDGWVVRLDDSGKIGTACSISSQTSAVPGTPTLAVVSPPPMVVPTTALVDSPSPVAIDTALTVIAQCSANGGPGSALPISPMESIPGKLADGTDQWFSFNGSGGDVVSLLAQGFYGLDAGIEFYKDDPALGPVLLAWDTSPAQDAFINNFVLPGTNYLIRVLTKNATVGEYVLHLSYPAPVTLGNGERELGKLSAPGDDAVFRFDGATDDQITVAAESPSGVPLVATLLGPDGTVLLVDDDFEGGDSNGVVFTTVLSQTGPYTLVFDAEDRVSTGVFSVLFSATSETTGAIAPGATFTGDLAPGWQRIFTFHAEAGRILSAAAFSHGSVDTDLALVRLSDSVVVATYVKSWDSWLDNVQIPTTGDYELIVSVGSDMGGATSGPFTLYVSDFDETPRTLVPGVRQVGSLGPLADDDFFRFSAAQDDMLTIELLPVSASSPLKFTVYDPSGNLLFADSSHEGGAWGGALNTFAAPIDGDYLVLVDGTVPDVQGTYEVLLTQAKTSSNAMTLGSSLAGRLLPGEEKRYAFTLDHPAFVSVLCRFTDSEATLGLWEATTPSLVTEQSFATEAFLDDVALPAGSYYLALSGATTSTGFTLYLSDGEAPTTLAPGMSFKGQFAQPADDDLFGITLNAGEQLVFTVSAFSMLSSIEVSLYDPSGTRVLNDWVAELPRSFTWTAGAMGPYTILLEAGNPYDLGSYQISVNVQGHLQGTISPGGMMAFLLNPLETATLSFTGVAKRRCSILADASNDATLTFELHDPADNPIAVSSQGAPILADDLFMPVDGSYRIMVGADRRTTVSVFLSEFDAAPDVLAPGATRHGYVPNAAADKLFSIPANPGDQFTVTGSNINMDVYSPDFTTLIASAVEDEWSSVSFTATEAGSYLLIADASRATQFFLQVGGSSGATITGGGAFTGMLRLGSQDRYQLDAAGGQFLSVTAVSTSGAGLNLELWSDGSLLASGSGAEAWIDNFPFPGNGTYDLVISGGPGAYALYVSDFGAAPQGLDGKNAVASVLSPPTDDDIFSLAANAGDRFEVVLENLGSKAVNLNVFDPDGTSVASVTDVWDQDRFELAALTAGTYLFLVDCSDPLATSAFRLGVYRISTTSAALAPVNTGVLAPGSADEYAFDFGDPQHDRYIVSAMAVAESPLRLTMEAVESVPPVGETVVIDDVPLTGTGRSALTVAWARGQRVPYTLVSSVAPVETVALPANLLVFLRAVEDRAFRFLHSGNALPVLLDTVKGGRVRMTLYNPRGKLWEGSTASGPINESVDLPPGEIIAVVQCESPFDWALARLELGQAAAVPRRRTAANQAIHYGETDTGTIVAGESRQYELAVTAGHAGRRVMITALSGGPDLDLVLRDPAGVARYASVAGVDGRIPDAVLSEGTWTIEIRSAGDGAYAVGVSEPGAEVPLSSRALSFLLSPFDERVFSFDGIAGETVLLQVAGECDGEVLKPDGTLLTQFPAASAVSSLGLPDTGSYRVRLTSLSSGVCSVQVLRAASRTIGFGEAVALTSNGQTQTLRLDAAGADVGKLFRVLVSAVEGRGSVEVLAVDGSVLAVAQVEPFASLDDLPILAAGSYLLRVTGKGTFVVGVSDRPVETPALLVDKKMLAGTISPPADEDLYEFNGSANEPVVLRVDTDLDTSIDLVLTSPSGSVVLRGRAKLYQATLPEDGTYNLLVRGQDMSEGWYSLYLMHSAGPTAVSYGSFRYIGTVPPVPARDVYELTVPSSDAGKLCSFKATAQDADLALVVMDPSGDQLLGVKRLGTWVVGPLPLETGKYRISVNSKGATKGYLFAVSDLPGDAGTNIVPGEHYGGLIGGFSDEKLYLFTAPAGKQVRFELEGKAQLTVLTPGGQGLFSDQPLVLTTEEGTYRLVMGSMTGDPGPYSIRAAYVGDDPISIGFGSERSVTIAAGGTARFDLDVADAQVGKTFSAAVKSGGDPIELSIWTPAGTLVRSTGGIPNPYTEGIPNPYIGDVLLTERGTWRLEVRNLSGWRDQDITIGVSSLPVQPPSPIALGERVVDIFRSIADEREYELTIAQPERISVLAKSFPWLDNDLLVFDGAGTLLAVAREDCDSEIGSVPLPSAGVYRIRVAAVGATKGAYELSVGRAQPGPSYSLGLGQETSSILDWANPIDEYVIDTGAGPFAPMSSLHIAAVGEGIPISMSLYEPSGTLVQRTLPMMTPVIDYPIGAGGQFRLVVEGADEEGLTAYTAPGLLPRMGGTDGANRFYRVGVSGLPLKSFRSLGFHSADSIDRVADQDGWTFEAIAGDEITLGVIGKTAGFMPEIALLSPSGRSLAAAFGGLGPPLLFGLKLPETGTYTAIVSGAKGTIGLYDIELRADQQGAINFGGALVGELRFDGDSDAYTLPGVNSGDRITVLCRGITSLDTDFWLIDPSGAVEAVAEKGRNSTLRGHKALRTGTYQIVVTGAAGLYELGVSDAAKETPTALTLGQPVFTQIAPLADEDVFTFDAVGGTTYLVDVGNISIGNTPYAEVYTSAGELVSRTGEVSEIPGFLAPADGTYTVLVHAGFDTGSLSLLVSPAAPLVRSATTITPGVTESTTLPLGGELLYTFYIAQPSVVSVVLDSQTSGVYVMLEGPSGEFISSTETASVACINNAWLDYPGDYYLRVGSTAGTADSFQLTIDVSRSPTPLHDGDVVTEYLDFPGDDDLFSFTAQEGDSVHIITSRVAGAKPLAVEVRGSSVPVVLEQYSIGTDTTIYTFRSECAGTYLAVADCNDPSVVGSYTLELQLGQETTQQITPGIPATAVLSKGDKATYEFHASAGDVVSLVAESADASDLTGDLYTEAAWLLASQTGPRIFLNNICLPADGIYRFSVGSAAADPTITATLWQSSGTGISENTEVSGTLAAGGEDQVYTFLASAGQPFRAVITSLSGNDLDAAAFGPDTRPVPLTVSNLAGGVVEVSGTAPSTGIHKLVVDTQSGVEGDAFTLWLYLGDSTTLDPGTTSYTGTLWHGDKLALRFPVGRGWVSAVAVGPVDFELQLPSGGRCPSVHGVPGSYLDPVASEVPGICTVILTTPQLTTAASFDFYLYDTSAVTPVSLPPGQSTDGTISTPGEPDVYSLDVPGPGRVFVRLDSALTMGGLVSSPLGPDFPLPPPDSAGVSSFLVPASGVYKLAVRSVGPFDTGSYSVAWSAEGDPGTPLHYGETATRSILPGASETFSFNGTAGDIVSIELQDPTGSLFFNLVDPTQVLLRSDSFTSGSRINNYLLPVSGTYRISVLSWDGLGGSFTIGLSGPTQPLVNLADGERASGRIEPLANDACFTFSAVQGDLAIFTLVGSPGVALNILGPAGSLLAWTAAESSTATELFFPVPATGSYFVVADAADGGSGFDYTLEFWLGQHRTGSADFTRATSFDVGRGDELSLWFDAAARQIVSAEAYPPAGVSVALSIVWAGGTVARGDARLDDVVLPQAGSYQVRLECTAGKGTVGLALSLSHFPSGSKLLRTSELRSVSTFNESLARAQDNTYSAFELEPGDELILSATGTVNVSATLFDPNMRRIYSDVPISDTELSQVVGVRGKYTILIDSTAPGEAGNYTLTGIISTPKSGGTLAYGRTEDGSLTAGDTIRYKFTGTSGDIVSIAALSDGTLDTDLALYAPSGVRIAARKEGRDSFVDDRPLTETGVYQVVVASANRTGGTYSIALSGTDSFASLAPGVAASGVLGMPAEDQGFSFDAAEGARALIEQTSGGFGLAFTLFAPDGSTVVENGNPGSVQRLPLAGTYRLIVDAADPRSTGAFSVKLEFPGTRLFAEAAAEVGLELRGVGASWSAVADYDRDGLPDIALVDGTGALRLYRNTGTGFTEVTSPAGVAVSNATSAVWGDYDNDGYPDLFVAVWGRNSLFHNLGNGTFTDKAAELGDAGALRSNCAAWVDFDLDGRLDLFVANKGLDSLFINGGAGGFRDVLRSAQKLATTAVAFADFNGDRYPDLLKIKADGSLQLFENQAGQSLKRVNKVPREAASAFAAWADFGSTDLVLDGKVYKVAADGTFRSVASLPAASRGVAADFDNDGTLDLLLSGAGGVHVLVGASGTLTDYASPGTEGATGILALSVLDFDGDGTLDVFAGGKARNYFFRNLSEPGKFAQLALQGTVSNRDAVGSRVAVTTPAGTQSRELGPTASSGQSQPIVHFGLRSAPATATVSWPSGRLSRIAGLALGAITQLVEPELPKVIATVPADGASVKTLTEIVITMADEFGIAELATELSIAVNGLDLDGFILETPGEGILRVVLTHPPSGLYEVKITPVNDLGVRGEQTTLSFRLDNVPPTVAGSTPPDGATVGELRVLRVTLRDDGALDEAATTVVVERDGNPYTQFTMTVPGPGVIEIDLLDIADGTYTFQITPVDKAGNVGLTRLIVITDVPSGLSAALSEILASPTSLVANGTSRATITVIPRDLAGQNMGTGLDVVLTTTKGTLSPVVGQADGTYQATLQSESTPGRATITATVNGTPLTRRATVDFVPDRSLFDLASVAGIPGPVLSVAVADLDGDGVDDLAAAVGSRVVVLLNDGFGNLGSAVRGQSIEFSEPVRVVKVLDADGDSDFDLLVLTQSKVLLLANDGGTLGAPVQLALPVQLSPAGADTGDINNDNRIDIAVVGEAGEVVFLLNTGAGFDFQVVNLGRSLEDIAFGDLDGDGDFDAAVVGNGLWFLMQDAGTFTATPILLPLDVRFTCVLPVDINQDNLLDLFVGSTGQDLLLLGPDFTAPPNLKLLRGSRLATTGSVGTDLLPGSSYGTLAAAAADFDGDDKPDLILGTRQGVHVLLNQGELVDYAADLPALNSPVYAVATGRADADGDADAFLGANGIRILTNLNPRIWFISPNGALAGEAGTVVRIYGSDFAGNPRVSFGTKAAQSAKALSREVIEATVPAGDAGVVDVSVVNDNGQGRSTVKPNAFNYTQLATFNLEVPGGRTVDYYRIVSIPLYLSKFDQFASAGNLGTPDNTLWRLYAYGNGAYREYPDIGLPGPDRALWLISAETKTLSFTGGRATGPIHIALAPGWNLFGSGLTRLVALSELQVSDGRRTVLFTGSENDLTGAIFEYNPGAAEAYKIARELRPGVGCWIYNRTPRTVLLTVGDSSGSAHKLVPSKKVHKARRPWKYPPPPPGGVRKRHR